MSTVINKSLLIPRSQQKCANCDNYLPMGPSQGQCLGSTPFPVLVGMRQPPPAILGGPMPPPEPVINSYFAPISPHRWCRHWTPKIEGEA